MSNTIETPTKTIAGVWMEQGVFMLKDEFLRQSKIVYGDNKFDYSNVEWEELVIQGGLK